MCLRDTPWSVEAQSLYLLPMYLFCDIYVEACIR